MIFPSKEGTAGRWTACGYGDTSHLSAAARANISRNLSLSQSLLTRLFQVSTQESAFVVTDTIATPVRNPSLATVASSLFPNRVMNASGKKDDTRWYRISETTDRSRFVDVRVKCACDAQAIADDLDEGQWMEIDEDDYWQNTKVKPLKSDDVLHPAM